MVGRAAALACAALLGGCTLITDSFLTNDFSGDPYPIQVETTSGAIVVGLRQPAHPDREVVLDLLSQLTLTDPGPGVPPSLSFLDLIVLGIGPDGAIDQPRAQLTEAQLVALHPCTSDVCTVGTAAAPRAFQGVIGPDVGGGDRGRSLDCDAVFGSPYRGGGTLVFPSTELPFGNRRITLQACLGPDPDPEPGLDATPDVSRYRTRGADALFVVSTGIGVSILDESAYARYRIAHPEAAELAALPVDAAYLPSGLVTGRRATIDRMALVASSTSNALAPCRQLYAHRLLTTFRMSAADCQRNDRGNPPLDCPCEDGSTFCAVPAILELAPAAPISVLIVPDTERTLQALRTELRPDQPEVDGLLGTDVLRAAEIDVDYPHDRLLARCTGAGCSARPELAQSGDVCQINRCIRGAGDQRACSAAHPLGDPTPLQ
jgi:hypothetical protein